MNIKKAFIEAHSAVLNRAFNDDGLNFIDYKIIELAATDNEGIITAINVYESICTPSYIHPTEEERIAEEEFLPRMKRLAESGYLIESEEENTPGIYKDFKLNLNTSK